MYARDQADGEKAKKGAKSGQARRSADGVAAGPSRILGLQGSVGNRNVSQMLAAGTGGSAAPTVQRVRDSIYEEGTYGARRRERDRLGREYGQPVSGRTHQSEHPIGFAVANNGGLPRRQMVGLEGSMPAYYETLDAHRGHDGTGMHSTAGSTGFNSGDYRDAQYEALRRNDPATAIFTNQAGYAHQPSFHAATGSVAGSQADDSYYHMVEARPRVPYIDRDTRQPRRTRRLWRQEQADLHSAREQARTGEYPDAAEQDRIMRLYGARSRTVRSNNRSDELESLQSYPDASDRSLSPVPSDWDGRGRARTRSPIRSRRSGSRRSVSRRAPSRGRSVSVAPPSLSMADSSLYEYVPAESSTSGGRDRSRSRHRSRTRSTSRRPRSVSVGRRSGRAVSPDDSTSYNTMLNSQVNPFGGPPSGGYARTAGIARVRPRHRSGRSRSRVAGRQRSSSRGSVYYDSDY